MTQHARPSNAFDRVDWLRRAIGEILPLIIFMREQIVPSMQASNEPRVSGSKTRTLAPLSIDPIDEADELWSKVCSLAYYYAERSGSWRALPNVIDKQRRIVTSAEITIIGFRSSNPDMIHDDIATVTRYLTDHAFTLAINPEYTASVDQLVHDIHAVRARYPSAPHKQQHRFKCPKCLRHGVIPIYTTTGEIQMLQCEKCGARRQF